MVDVHLMVSEVPGEGRQCRVFATRQAALTFAGRQAAQGGAGVVARLATPSQASPVGFGDAKQHAGVAKAMLRKMTQRSAAGRPQ